MNPRMKIISLVFALALLILVTLVFHLNFNQTNQPRIGNKPEVGTPTSNSEVGTPTVNPEVGTPKKMEKTKPENENAYLNREIIFINSSYKIARPIGTGSFKNGQNADIVLSWFDFNYSGGPLVFNHPMGIASDGKYFALADTRNNRILIWNHLPTGNEAPDVVVGQDNFNSCEPGTSRNKLRWPVDVSIGGGKLVVADTYNNRVLIWNHIPEKNGEPADIVLGQENFETRKENLADENAIIWPWSVWTDGEKLIVTNTLGGRVLIWNSFPTRNNQPPDLIIKLEEFGTPRNIITDGKTYLIIGDHNARVNGKERGGLFIWHGFPTENKKYDTFIRGPVWATALIGDDLYILDKPYVIVKNFSKLRGILDLDRPEAEMEGIERLDINLEVGDGSEMIYLGEKNVTYVSLYNGGRVVGYFGKPHKRIPDFSIGSDDPMSNPLINKYYFVDGGRPIVYNNSLILLAGFNRMILVWKHIPDESGALPDIVYRLQFEPAGGAFWNGKFYVIGRGGNGGGLSVWSSDGILNGKPPEITKGGYACGVDIHEGHDIEFDSKYAYLLSGGHLYIYEQPFTLDSKPIKELKTDEPVVGVSSNGEKLAVLENGKVLIFDIDSLLSDSPKYVEIHNLGKAGGFNLPGDLFLSKDKLFVADTCFNRVLIWKGIPEKDNEEPDIVLGQHSFDEWQPPRYTRDGLFWPGGLWYSNNYLWVSEMKFSSRLLRYSGS